MEELKHQAQSRTTRGMDLFTSCQQSNPISVDLRSRQLSHAECSCGQNSLSGLHLSPSIPPAPVCTVFVRSVSAATFLIGLVGITWALTLWAPWAIISAEISRRDEIRRAQYAQRNLWPDGRAGVASLDGYSSDEDRERSLTNADEDQDQDDADQAGVILGIHNMAIAAPQIIATVSSSIIFRFFQKPRGVPGDHSIAIVLALGGITVLISAFFIHQIKDDVGTPVDAMSAVEDGDAASSRPSTSHSRPRSFEQLPRASLERAALVRNKSFSGVEY